MKGKLIVIEGTDCSGKETQSKLLMEKLQKLNITMTRYSFPNYDSPTGKIVGGPYLGKSYICEGWFEEGAGNVDPKVASLYYAADRRYNIGVIKEKLDNGINVILDRYTFSNMAHQGGKISNKMERNSMYEWLEKLEFDLLELPREDIAVFLHMPYIMTTQLRNNRPESADQHESNPEHLVQAEQAYIEMADKYKFKIIECSSDNKLKSIEEINEELFNYIYNILKS